MTARRACLVGACASVLAPLAAVTLFTPVAFAQTESQVTLTRKDTTIVVTLKAQYADGARFIGNDPNCGTGVRQTLLYGPAPGYVETRVGKDTELRSNVAIVRTVDAGAGGAAAAGGAAGAGGAGAAGGTAATGGAAAAGGTAGAAGTAGAGATSGAGGTAAAGGAGDAGTGKNAGQAANGAEQQTLELFDGTATINRAGCIESAERVSKPSVMLIQGRTTVKGTRFFLDQGKDTGTMEGPVELDRSASGSASALTATADGMTFDTQTRRTTLSGHVQVSSGGRVTTASTLELDENAGVAVLTGAPARSTKGSDVLQGNTLRYYLDSNDVVVLGNVQGEVQLDVPSQ